MPTLPGATTGAPNNSTRAATFSAAVLQLFTSAMLVLSILVAAGAVSLGIARAETLGGAVEPDALLVLALFAAAILAMGLLSAAAVRFASRSRD